MTLANQITVCPPNVRHHFKDMRSKSKQAGPPFHLMSRCTRCVAILHQIITTKTLTNGDVVPEHRAYILAFGRTMQVPATTQEVAPEKA